MNPCVYRCVELAETITQPGNEPMLFRAKRILEQKVFTNQLKGPYMYITN